MWSKQIVFSATFEFNWLFGGSTSHVKFEKKLEAGSYLEAAKILVTMEDQVLELEGCSTAMEQPRVTRILRLQCRKYRSLLRVRLEQLLADGVTVEEGMVVVQHSMTGVSGHSHFEVWYLFSHHASSRAHCFPLCRLLCRLGKSLWHSGYVPLLACR